MLINESNIYYKNFYFVTQTESYNHLHCIFTDNEHSITIFFISYAMNGLSADKLRLLLQPYEESEIDPETDDQTAETGDNPFALDFNKSNRKGSSSSKDQDGKDKFDFRDNMVLATLKDSTRGEWKSAQVMYSFPSSHKVEKI